MLLVESAEPRSIPVMRFWFDDPPPWPNARSPCRWAIPAQLGCTWAVSRAGVLRSVAVNSHLVRPWGPPTARRFSPPVQHHSRASCGAGSEQQLECSPHTRQATASPAPSPYVWRPLRKCRGEQIGASESVRTPTLPT